MTEQPWLFTDLRAQVRDDDGTVFYCPECGSIGPLGWCTHGFGMFGLDDRAKRVHAAVSDEALRFSEDEDHPGNWYAYVDLKLVPNV